jgi:hypothetical protein
MRIYCICQVLKYLRNNSILHYKGKNTVLCASPSGRSAQRNNSVKSAQIHRLTFCTRSAVSWTPRASLRSHSLTPLSHIAARRCAPQRRIQTAVNCKFFPAIVCLRFCAIHGAKNIIERIL